MQQVKSMPPPPSLNSHFGYYPAMMCHEPDMSTFEKLRSELIFSRGDTFDSRFKLHVHRPDRRGCATAMEAVLRTGSPALFEVVERLCAIFELELHRCWINLYRGGTDDRAEFHRDNFDGRSGGSHVSLGLFASFGASRYLCWRWHGPHSGKGPPSAIPCSRESVWRVQQSNGDVFAFDRHANSAGSHSIEPDLSGGDRISVSLWGCGSLPTTLPTLSDPSPSMSTDTPAPCCEQPSVAMVASGGNAQGEANATRRRWGRLGTMTDHAFQ